MPHKAPNADFLHLFRIKVDYEILEVGIFQLFFNLGRNLIVLSLIYHFYVNLEYTLAQICLFYVVANVFFFLTAPLVGGVIEKVGIKHSLALRAVSATFYWLSIGHIISADFMTSLLMMMPLMALRSFGGNASAVAYDIFLSQHLTKGSNGKALAGMQIAIAASTIIAPILGGFVTQYFGFVWTTYIGVLCFFIGGIVLMLTPDEKFKLDYSPRKLVKDAVSKTPKALYLGEFGRVFFDGVMFLIWPLFLVLVIDDMSTVGMVAGVSSGLAIIAAFIMGKRLDKPGSSPAKTLKFGAYRSMFINFVRGIWWEPITLAAVDAVSKVNDQTMKVPYDMQLYTWIKETNSIERAHIRQISIQLFYLISFLVAYILFLVFDSAPNYVFIAMFLISAASLWFCAFISNLQKKEISKVEQQQKVVIEGVEVVVN